MLKNLSKLLDINLKQSSNVETDVDIDIGEKIIEKLFLFIKNNIDKDTKIDILSKGAVLFYLPGVKKGSIEYIHRNQTNAKVLLDDIQKELNRRR